MRLAGFWSLRAVGRERSQVSRMLKSLVATGLIEQDPETRAYRLGLPMYALTARAGDQQLLRRASPVLRALALETGESVVLSVLRGMVAALNVSGSSERMCDRVATHSIAAQGAAMRIFPGFGHEGVACSLKI